MLNSRQVQNSGELESSLRLKGGIHEVIVIDVDLNNGLELVMAQFPRLLIEYAQAIYVDMEQYLPQEVQQVVELRGFLQLGPLQLRLLGFTRHGYSHLVLNPPRAMTEERKHPGPKGTSPQMLRLEYQAKKDPTWRDSFRVIQQAGSAAAGCPAIWLHCHSLDCYRDALDRLRAADKKEKAGGLPCLVVYLGGLSLFDLKDWPAKENLPKLPAWMTLKLHWSRLASPAVPVERARWQAEEDGCPTLWIVRQPTVELNDWLDRLKNPSVEAVKVASVPLPRLCFHVWLEHWEWVRELVGSIHDWVAESGLGLEAFPLIILSHSSSLSTSQREIISLWQNVELRQSQGEEEELELQWLLSMEEHLSLADIHMGVHEACAFAPDTLTKLSHSLSAESLSDGDGLIRIVDDKRLLHEAEKRAAMRMEAYTVQGWLRLNQHRLGCLRGWSKWGNCTQPYTLEPLHPVNQPRSMEEVGLHYTQPVLNERDERVEAGDWKHFCNVIIREAAVSLTTPSSNHTSQWLTPAHRHAQARGEKKQLAMLIPTKNSETDTPQTVALLQICLKSLLASIMPLEWDRFQVILYLGYDHLDPLLDQPAGLEAFKQELFALLGDRNVLVKLHRLPASKWATFLWNSLYADAIQDGNDFFYAINDDISFGEEQEALGPQEGDEPRGNGTTGWLTWMTERLEAAGGVGVAGPNDLMWGCRLLTQSMVTAQHWQMFGTYYPLAIKDWYSDNWIGDVYPATHRHCHLRWTIRNSAVATRYTACDRPKWQRPLEEGRQRILNHLSNPRTDK